MDKDTMLIGVAVIIAVTAIIIVMILSQGKESSSASPSSPLPPIHIPSAVSGYCGDGNCSNESCSVCPIDCGNCTPVQTPADRPVSTPLPPGVQCNAEWRCTSPGMVCVNGTCAPVKIGSDGSAQGGWDQPA